MRGPSWAVCIAIPVVYRYVRTCHPRLHVLIAASYLHASWSTLSDSTAAFSSSVFSTATGGSVEPLLCGRSCSSRARSFLKSGRNRSIRFHDSDHSFSFDGSWLGGTRYPLLDMNKSTFFRFSGTASSWKELNVSTRNSLGQLRKGVSYKAVSLTAVHEAVHDVDDLEPQI